jgi:hypothetical protein
LIFKERAEKQVEGPASRVEGRSSFALARLRRDGGNWWRVERRVESQGARVEGIMMEKLQAKKMKVERVEQKYPE